MRFEEIVESTTSGSVATVASPMGKVQKRGGNLLSGKKTNKKYANSVEARKQVKESQTVSEEDISEQDVIVVPSQAKKLKSGFISHDEDRRDHEVEMALSDLFQCAKNAKTVYELLKDVPEEVGIEGWVQEKIIKANDYLNTICEYLEHKALTDESAGVIAGGGIGEEKSKVKNPYAVGMAQAMKTTGDKPPLKKSTITKAHDIAKAVKKDK